ncbi:YjjG family noncanonical pyrimidine nucleotidase [Streptococcus cuniculi]|uniref:Noncanonical pyrimidine nucleotidase, YjjG family n=1 Tax=Streptococcus cuniculi TaxID=1432788 RepID=A0A4Y9JEU5_9STRE|nr:YjjG family noncanonical pyrimidine nucleotidase [Streptococcus cuniculi]MBF0777846.1 noncanonical pyrimidine nucleotidase, YjjG family [Streptococcus cuniculi]TFU98479.1 noncanonical pyrimidine nucleotidase, YjjG family [Streptococcus cuniculi]
MYYKFLLFDLDHTLLDFAAGEELALTQFLEAMGVEDKVAFKDYYKPMNQAMWKDLERGKISKLELINTRFARAFAHFGREVDGREMALLYQEYISQQGQTFEGAVELLEQLKELGYELYGATNGVTYIQENRLAHSPIQSFFKEVFISEQMGTKKPEAFFFEKIAERIAGFKKEQALMIGDSLTADVQGGNNAGIDTIWYNPTSLENHTSAKPTYQVKNYQELLALLQETKEEDK